MSTLFIYVTKIVLFLPKWYKLFGIIGKRLFN